MECKHCGSILVGKLGDYYYCKNPTCLKLLEHVDLEEREKENNRRSSVLVDSGE